MAREQRVAYMCQELRQIVLSSFWQAAVMQLLNIPRHLSRLVTGLTVLLALLLSGCSGGGGARLKREQLLT
jgi:hypothetical protein